MYTHTHTHTHTYMINTRAGARRKPTEAPSSPCCLSRQ